MSDMVVFDGKGYIGVWCLQCGVHMFVLQDAESVECMNCHCVWPILPRTGELSPGEYIITEPIQMRKGDVLQGNRDGSTVLKWEPRR